MLMLQARCGLFSKLSHLRRPATHSRKKITVTKLSRSMDSLVMKLSICKIGQQNQRTKSSCRGVPYIKDIVGEMITGHEILVQGS